MQDIVKQTEIRLLFSTPEFFLALERIDTVKKSNDIIIMEEREISSRLRDEYLKRHFGKGEIVSFKT